MVVAQIWGAIIGAAFDLTPGWSYHKNADGSVDMYSATVDFNNIYAMGTGRARSLSYGYFNVPNHVYVNC